MKTPVKASPGLVITNGKGRLFVQTLLPQDAVVTLRTGTELYRYDGRDYPPQRDTGPAPECRVEICPSKTSRTDFFLHVLTASDATVATVPMASLVQTASTVRVQVGQATISFAKQKLNCAIEVP